MKSEEWKKIDWIKSRKTPYFLINRKKLDEGIYRLQNALESAWGNYNIGYSYKTNALPWLIRYIDTKGLHAEVVSDDEYRLARIIGVDKNRMIYNGIAKSEDTFFDAVKNHSIVNIDSEYEIEWLDKLEDYDGEVGIRVNFDLESKCPGQTQCGKEGERFGFCYENGELKKAIEDIEKKGIKVVGLHLHKSSKTRMPDIYQAIAETAVEIAKNYSLELKYVDIGGGFFGDLEGKPQFYEYFNMIAGILKRQFNPKKTTLIVEPGMALIGGVVDYVTTIVDIKKTTRNIFVITDGSRIHIDPLMSKSNYFYEIDRKENDRNEINRQIICGFTCMEHDRIFELKDDKELRPGDEIIYHKVGAYTMSLSPLFIKWFPDVYVKDEKRIRKIRNRWTSDEYKLQEEGADD